MKTKSPWLYIPTLYFGEGLPYIIITTLSMIMYKRMGLTDAQIAFYTSYFYFPWVVKPLWSPFVDLIRTKRFWIVLTQFLMGIFFAAVAFFLPTSFFIQTTIALFWLLAFSSATHDIAADGFYLHALSEHEQSYFVGIRNTFYRIALLSGQGLMLLIVGAISYYVDNVALVWSSIFLLLAAILVGLSIYHFFLLPHPPTDINHTHVSPLALAKEVILSIVSFTRRKGFATAIIFILFYRLPEALLSKSVPLFLIASPEMGGMGLSDTDYGITQIVGVIGLVLGVIISGVLVSRKGLRYWLYPMVCAISLPDIVYVYLSFFPTTHIIGTSILIGIEQFGYGVGFTAYTLFMIYFTQGEHRTSHFALCTGLMALGMMLPGFIAGEMLRILPYHLLFIIILCLTAVTFAVASIVKIDPNFGKKQAA